MEDEHDEGQEGGGVRGDEGAVWGVFFDGTEASRGAASFAFRNRQPNEVCVSWLALLSPTLFSFSLSSFPFLFFLFTLFSISQISLSI